MLQFSFDKKIEDEQFMFQKYFVHYPERIQLFPEGNVLPSEDGGWIPQIEHCQKKDVRIAKWLG